VGVGVCDVEVVWVLVIEGLVCVRELVVMGVEFDCMFEGEIVLM